MRTRPRRLRFLGAVSVTAPIPVELGRQRVYETCAPSGRRTYDAHEPITPAPFRDVEPANRDARCAATPPRPRCLQVLVATNLQRSVPVVRRRPRDSDTCALTPTMNLPSLMPAERPGPRDHDSCARLGQFTFKLRYVLHYDVRLCVMPALARREEAASCAPYRAMIPTRV